MRRFWKSAWLVLLVPVVTAIAPAVRVAAAGDTPLQLDKTSIDFGSVNLGNTSATVDVTVTNTSQSSYGPIEMYGGPPPVGPFEVTGQNCASATLAPSGTCAITYKYTPSALGAQTAQSQFIFSLGLEQDGETFTVDLSGTGVIPITPVPASLDFGSVQVGNSSGQLQSLLTNNSADPFGPIDMFGGGLSSPFSNTQNCQGATLAPGGTCAINYTFTPVAPGLVQITNEFAIGAQAVDGPTIPLAVELEGCGFEPRSNCPDAQITVTKSVLPDTTPAWSFDFTISPDPDGQGGQPDTQTVSKPGTDTVTWIVDAGQQYTLTELVPSGWAAGQLVCQGELLQGPSRLAHAPAGQKSPPPPPPPGVATYTPLPDDHVQCDITNLANPVINIRKVTTGGFGGPFHVVVDDGSSTIYGSPDLTTTVADLPSPVSVVHAGPGTVRISETSTPSGFYPVSLACASDSTAPNNAFIDSTPPLSGTLTLANGRTANCLVTNETAAKVTVTKVVKPVSFTGDWSATFAIAPVPAGESSPKVATKASPTVTWNNLDPGVQYVITESDPATGFAKGAVECTGVTPPTAPPGPSRVPHGVGGRDASFTPYPGNDVQCTATNYAPPMVTIQKVTERGTGGPFHFVVNNDNGQKPVTQFNAQDITTTDGSPTPTNPTPIVVAPGWVKVSETDIPAHWEGEFLTCDLINRDGQLEDEFNDDVAPFSIGRDLQSGEVLACVAENLRLPSVTVTKTVVGPTPWSFDFTISPVPAGQPAVRTATNLNPSVTWFDIDPKVEYTVSEVGNSNYIVTDDMTCGGPPPGPGRPAHVVPQGDDPDDPLADTFVVGRFGDVQCAITNTAKSRIVVTKVVQNESPNDNWSFAFTLNPGNVKRTATRALPTVSFDGLDPAIDYTITEANPFDPKYQLGTISCDGSTEDAGEGIEVAVDPGETIYCTATNYRQLSDIAVTKTPNVSTVSLGSTVVWTLNMINNGPAPADEVVLYDPLPDALDLVSVTPTGGWDCSGSTLGHFGVVYCTKSNMAVGETASFSVVTSVNVLIGSDPIVNGVSVSTSTQESTLVNNSDEAQVEPEDLPVTGSDTNGLVALGVGLVGAGSLLTRLTRRRRRLA